MPVPSASQTPVQLHRIRFLDNTPSPITVLSFAPLPLPPPEGDKGKGKSKLAEGKEELGVLVLARENGDVEIWQWARDEEGGVGNWILEKVLPPTLTHPSITLMALVIRNPTEFHLKPYAVPKIEDLRLFTAGSDSTELAERCLITGRILNITPVPSAPIWSIAVSPTHSVLCLSTTAPTLSFLSVPSDNSPLQPPPPHLLRCEALPSRTRTVSISWGPPRVMELEGEKQWVDTYIITGNSDSSIRKWELPSPAESGRSIGRVSLKSRAVVEKVQKNGRGAGKKSHGNQKGTIVWGVGVLSDHTIVSSDSLGSVTFWDGTSLAQKQSFQAHKADGMCMAIGPNGRSVFTSGPDQRVCQFSSILSPSGESRWVLSGSKRIHSHDVRSLAVFPPYTPHAAPLNPHLAPVLASGGWDMSLSLSPAAASDLLASGLRNPLSKPTAHNRTVFDESFTRKMSYGGGGKGTGRVSVGRKGRLVACRKDRSVGIWRVLDAEQGWEKVLDMDLRLRTNLIASAISDDGKWLAVSDLYETKLFRLESQPTGDIAPRRVKTFLNTLSTSEALSQLSISSTGSGCSSLLFTPDSQRLIMGLTHMSVVVVALPPSGEEVRVMECFQPLQSDGGRVVKQKKGLGPISKKRRSLDTEDIDMADGFVNGEPNGVSDAEDEEEEEEDDDAEISEERETSTPGAWIVCLAASEDGQWLATSDLLRRIAIYNLDTLRQHVILPTLPQSPSAIAFPPAHPSLLAITIPTGSLQFYHIENRRLLPPTPQLATLNAALRTQFTPVQSMSFEPTRSNTRASRVVLWSHDWLCSVQLDLEIIGRQAGKKGNAALTNSDSHPGGASGKILGLPIESPSSTDALSRSSRKKRAREAREALELVSISGSSDQPSLSIASPRAKSSADDPEFYKLQNDAFRGVAGVDWFGPGEMVVAERPYGDFLVAGVMGVIGHCAVLQTKEDEAAAATAEMERQMEIEFDEEVELEEELEMELAEMDADEEM